jgi:hypothetical protein
MGPIKFPDEGVYTGILADVAKLGTALASTGLFPKYAYSMALLHQESGVMIQLGNISHASDIEHHLKYLAALEKKANG